MFADLCGFTSISENLDPEEVTSLQHDLFSQLSDCVAAYGGYVDKLMGDGLLALFGAPVAREDDPERALRCALAMHSRTHDLWARWKHLGAPLNLHIGVNTGTVVAGHFDSSDYSVTGDAVNTASRLQSLAGPREVLVGPVTHRLTCQLFEFEALGQTNLRGRKEPLWIYRLLGALQTARPARGLASLGLSAPLIGRDKELARVIAAFERSCGGDVEIVRLVGDAGVGKTRLVEAFLEWVRKEGGGESIAVRRVNASALEARSYGVFADILRTAYEIPKNGSDETVRLRLESGLRAIKVSDEEIAAVAPAVVRLLDLNVVPENAGPTDPEVVRRHIVFATRSMLEHRMALGPLLLVIEDLHWADAASIELLRILADELDGRPLMLLVTHRPEFNPAGLATFKAAQTAIRVPPLNPRDATELFEALFGATATRIPATLRETALEHAGGNPLYLEELVRGLIEDGILVRGIDGWTAQATPGALSVPDTLHGLLLARVDRLPAGARKVAQEAAVLGSTFELGVLKTICSAPSEIDGALRRLLEADILKELSNSEADLGVRRLQFAHTLLREVIYHNTLLKTRTALHRRAADVLESQAVSTTRHSDHLLALARHLEFGGEPVRAAGLMLDAADRERSIYANEDALRHYRRAMELLASRPDCEDERLKLRERIANLLGPTGSPADALAEFEALLAVYAERGDHLAQARLHRKVALLLWDSGAREEAVQRCRVGMGLAEAAGKHIEVALHYGELGRITFRTGDFAQAASWAERALAYVEGLVGDAHPAAETAAERREVARVVSQAQNTLGVALARQGSTREAVGWVERSLRVAQGYNLVEATLRCHTNLGVLYSLLDPQQAIETCQAGLKLARKVGDLRYEARLSTNIAVAYCSFTNQCTEQGIAAAQRAVELDRKLALRDHLAVSLTVLGQICQCHGSTEDALRYYSEALEIAAASDEAQLLFPCYEGIGSLYLAGEDEARAEEFFLKAGSVCERAGLDPNALVVLPFLE